MSGTMGSDQWSNKSKYDEMKLTRAMDERMIRVVSNANFFSSFFVGIELFFLIFYIKFLHSKHAIIINKVRATIKLRCHKKVGAIAKLRGEGPSRGRMAMGIR